VENLSASAELVEKNDVVVSSTPPKSTPEKAEQNGSGRIVYSTQFNSQEWAEKKCSVRVVYSPK